MVSQFIDSYGPVDVIKSEHLSCLWSTSQPEVEPHVWICCHLKEREADLSQRQWNIIFVFSEYNHSDICSLIIDLMRAEAPPLPVPIMDLIDQIFVWYWREMIKYWSGLNWVRISHVMFVSLSSDWMKQWRRLLTSSLQSCSWISAAHRTEPEPSLTQLSPCWFWCRVDETMWLTELQH